MTDTVRIIVIVLPILLLSITLHELMHAFIAYKLGDDTAHDQGRISLNPAQHIDPVLTLGLPLLLAILHLPIFAVAKPVEINMNRVKYRELGAALIAAAGPLTNLLLAILSASLLNVLQPIPGDFLSDFLSYSVIINVGLFVFNSIPWPPLDGSRVLYAFAPRGLQEQMIKIEQTGITGLLIFMMVYYYLLSPFVSQIIQNLVARLAPQLI